MAVTRDMAVELAEKSLDAIDKITAQANFYLTILALVIGLAAIFGWALLQEGANRVAKEISEQRLKAFLNSDEGRKFIRDTIAEEVKAQTENKAFGEVKPLGEDDDIEAFPEPPPVRKSRRKA